MATESMRLIESVIKALSIVECFSLERPEWNLKELNAATGIPKSGILRLCGTLQSKGYIRRDPATKIYRLGYKFLTFGKIYEETTTLISLANPILLELVQATNESASLFVREGLNRVCLAKQNGPHVVRFTYTEGQVLELTAGAGGKVLLAFSESEVFDKVLPTSDSNLRAVRKQLETELKEIREQGYAVSLGEKISEAAAVAAPVFNHEGKVCAAITLAGPIQRFSKKNRKSLLKHLQQGASKLSVLLGHPKKKGAVSKK